MSSFSVVLDACVLIPGSLRSTLLRASSSRLYRAHWSEDILLEVHRNLAPLTTEARAQQTVAWLRERFEESIVDGYVPLIPSIPLEHDQHVVAAAVVARAQVIVTSNLKHFPNNRLAQFEIEAQSPDQFLCDLIDLHSDAMIDIIRQQASALKNPPMSPREVLDNLAVHAPAFAAIARNAFCVSEH